MSDDTTTSMPAGIEVIAKLMKLYPDKHLVKRRQADGSKVDDFEIVYIMKLQLKRQKLDIDGNVKDETGDPWINATLSSTDENQFKDFADMKMGDEVLINIMPL